MDPIVLLLTPLDGGFIFEFPGALLQNGYGEGVPIRSGHPILGRWHILDQILTEPLWARDPRIMTERPGFYEAQSVPSHVITNQQF